MNLAVPILRASGGICFTSVQIYTECDGYRSQRSKQMFKQSTRIFMRLLAVLIALKCYHEKCLKQPMEAAQKIKIGLEQSSGPEGLCYMRYLV